MTSSFFNMIGFLIALITGILLLSEYYRSQRKRYLKEGTLTEGEIVSLRRKAAIPAVRKKGHQKPDQRAVNYYKVAYLDQFGVRHTLRFEEKGYQKYEQHDTVPVRYLPNMPASGKIAREGDLMMPIYSCYIAVFFLTVFLGVIVTVVILDQRRR